MTFSRPCQRTDRLSRLVWLLVRKTEVSLLMSANPQRRQSSGNIPCAASTSRDSCVRISRTRSKYAVITNRLVILNGSQKGTQNSLQTPWKWYPHHYHHAWLLEKPKNLSWLTRLGKRLYSDDTKSVDCRLLLIQFEGLYFIPTNRKCGQRFSARAPIEATVSCRIDSSRLLLSVFWWHLCACAYVIQVGQWQWRHVCYETSPARWRQVPQISRGDHEFCCAPDWQQVRLPGCAAGSRYQNDTGDNRSLFFDPWSSVV